MKSYYIMIQFSGGYVTGFFCPQALDEADALKKTKKLLIVAIKILETSNSHKNNVHFQNLKRVKSFMQSLKRPWRKTKGRFDHIPDFIVKIKEWNLPFQCGYWISMVGLEDKYLCNILQ